jgi:hypothetical protein
VGARAVAGRVVGGGGVTVGVEAAQPGKQNR